ncbi:helix-turn-helix domain-containing protein [Flavobacterium poyangense]|uniref:helix-turn-helix domain-containing protein n=1 Tax=Flavobacterium poyangense TaxID=2204302 RepID=UPI00141DDC94|nr:helix-turn-helix transcriptional regulator [Flavobacterium sp. JXAS1]
MINEEIKDSFLLLFGKNLEDNRKKKKLSYRELAQNCDLDHSYISKIEKGEINLTLETLLELMKALNISAKDLFDFDFDVNKLNRSE